MGQGGVVASRYIFGTSRRLSLPLLMARGRAHGGAIVPYGPFFLSVGVLGTGQGGFLALQSWAIPEDGPLGFRGRRQLL